jgi:hypothetical protein
LILKPPDVIVNYREQDLVSALREWEASRDASKAHLKLQRNKFTIEGQLLFNLKKMGNDLVGALQTVRVFTFTLLKGSFTEGNRINLCGVLRDSPDIGII